MAATDDVAAGPLQAPEVPPPKTPRSRLFRGKSVSSRFNLFRDSDAQPSPGPRDDPKGFAGARNPPASISLLQAPDLPPIPNFVLSANPKNDSSPSLIERRFFGGELKPPPSPSARSFYSEPGSPFGTPLSRPVSRAEREIDQLAAQLELEIEEAHRKKEAALQSCKQDDVARCADDVARLEAERDLVIDEQRKFDLARLQAQPTTPSSAKPKRVMLEKLNLFSKSRKPSSSTFIQPPLTPLLPGTPSTTAPTVFTPTPSLSRRSSLDDSPPLHPSHRMSFIQPHPDGDAPISASNGGERVSVLLGPSGLVLPLSRVC